MKTTDEEAVRRLLQATASDEASTVDPLPLIARGERRFRRRRWIAVGTAVAAVVVSATVLPGLGHRAALDRTDPASAGEDRALRLLSPTEAADKCRQQWSAIAGHDVGQVRMTGKSTDHVDGGRPTLLTPQELAAFVERQQEDYQRTGLGPKPIDHFGYWPGTAEPVVDRRGQRFVCLVPGNWTPSAEDLATDSSPIPDDDASLLRRCSVIFWHDFSEWRVEARQIEPGIAATIVATSPGGELAVDCVVTARSARPAVYTAPRYRPSITTVHIRYTAERRSYVDPDRPRPTGTLLGTGVWNCVQSSCPGWVFAAAGRVTNNVVRLLATTPQGRQIEIPVHDGWFAASFAHRGPAEKGKVVRGTLTAYDAEGKVIEEGEYTSMPAPR